MNLLLEKIARLEIGWNERPLDEADAHRLCWRFAVTLDERPLSTDGFYYRIFGRDFIAINSPLRAPAKLNVLFHDMAHCLFHAPVSGPAIGFYRLGKRTRQEREADTFALCALIPKARLAVRTCDDLLEYGFTHETIAVRYEIFKRHDL